MSSTFFAHHRNASRGVPLSARLDRVESWPTMSTIFMRTASTGTLARPATLSHIARTSSSRIRTQSPTSLRPTLRRSPVFYPADPCAASASPICNATSAPTPSAGLDSGPKPPASTCPLHPLRQHATSPPAPGSPSSSSNPMFTTPPRLSKAGSTSSTRASACSRGYPASTHGLELLLSSYDLEDSFLY